MISLARFVNEHDEALDYDLMTRTNYQLNDLGGVLSWGALRGFIKNLGGESALARDIGKATGWETTAKTNTILADIFDLLQVINANVVALATNGKKKMKIKPYPRPGQGNKNERKIGRGAIPVTDLREFIKRRGANG